MKRFLTLMLTLVFVLGCLPGTDALAKSSRMNDGVPVWDETTVKEYAMDFIHGHDMDRLFGYYDLQIRRYMPRETYAAMLSELEWMTGGFLGFGTYRTYQETELKTKTHVLHLCMEKQDLELYFTHKDEEDDWEVMAVEFAPAEEQPVLDDEQEAEQQYAVDAAAKSNYTTLEVKVGSAPYLLDGILTLPTGASPTNQVPAVVLVHGFGPSDMDATIGQTKLFADIADLFAKKGIATLRYDKRTYTYGSTMTAEEIQALTVEEETIQDAISAGQLLLQNESIRQDRIVLLGHSMGAMLAPRIVSESDGVFSAMIMIAGSPKSLLDISLTQNDQVLATLTGEAYDEAAAQIAAYEEQIKALKRAKTAEAAKEITIGGINGYYFWEMMQVDTTKLISRMKLPTYIVQGNADFQVSLADGIEAYEDALGSRSNFVQYKIFRKLNHLLMNYDGPVSAKGTIAEYDTPATMDTVAGRNLADWILNLGTTSDEE